MVATRGTDQTISFITGSSRIDPTTIAVEEWVQIIRAAIEELPISYMRGLRPIKQILQHGELEYNGHTVDFRRVPKSLPIIHVKSLQGVGKLLRESEIFLHCAEVSDLPEGASTSERWEKAPRSSTIPGELSVVDVVDFLLSREKKLYYMLTKWKPHEYRAHDMQRTPEFWYEPDVVEFEELDDGHLCSYLANAAESGVAKRMLHSFHRALVRTTGDMQSQYVRVLEKQHTIGGYLDRFGELAR